jgi:cellulose synthase/poly-beta-1,6-N-acetylglucosamine synthase-like glycosyltransferase
MEMDIPKEIHDVDYVVVEDRCTDNTGQIAKSMGATVLTKEFRGKYVSAIAEAVAYGVQNTQGELILKCDSDIVATKNALNIIIQHLGQDTGRVSSEIRTRTGKWWLDLLMLARDLSFLIAPLGEAPRGGFTLFRREIVKQIGGFDESKPTWDTAFDIRLKKAGYQVKKVKEATVIEFRRDLTIGRIIKHQISAGQSRRELGVSFWRTLLHSIFRGRPFVLYGYLKGLKPTMKEK